MNCVGCGRYCGSLPYVWNDDPWLCSEGCAEAYHQRNRRTNERAE